MKRNQLWVTAVAVLLILTACQLATHNIPTWMFVVAAVILAGSILLRITDGKTRRTPD